MTCLINASTSTCRRALKCPSGRESALPLALPPPLPPLLPPPPARLLPRSRFCCWYTSSTTVASKNRAWSGPAAACNSVPSTRSSLVCISSWGNAQRPHVTSDPPAWAFIARLTSQLEHCHPHTSSGTVLRSRTFLTLQLSPSAMHHKKVLCQQQANIGVHAWLSSWPGARPLRRLAIAPRLQR